MKSVYVRELEEFGWRLERDGYPTALIERAAERMQQLEELVVSNNEKFQKIERDVRSMTKLLDEIKNLPMCKEQAE